jgi:hypothetical protein
MGEVIIRFTSNAERCEQTKKEQSSIVMYTVVVELTEAVECRDLVSVSRVLAAVTVLCDTEVVEFLLWVPECVGAKEAECNMVTVRFNMMV